MMFRFAKFQCRISSEDLQKFVESAQLILAGHPVMRCEKVAREGAGAHREWGRGKVVGKAV